MSQETCPGIRYVAYYTCKLYQDGPLLGSIFVKSKKIKIWLCFVFLQLDLHVYNLQDEWDNIVSWSLSTHLPLNTQKCCVLDFVTKRSLPLLPISLSPSDSLKQVDSLRFLGVRFSSSLKWNSHFDFIIKKACKRIYVVRNLRRSGVPSVFLWRSYVALIRSVLIYAYPCFCNAPQFLMNNLLRVERRVCRIINDDSVCNPSLLQACEASCDQLFNVILQTSSHPLRKLFRTCVAPRETRTVKTFLRPFAKTKRFSSSFIKFCR